MEDIHDLLLYSLYIIMLGKEKRHQGYTGGKLEVTCHDSGV